VVAGRVGTAEPWGVPLMGDHEIGHTLGLAHVRLSGNVMNTPAGTSWHSDQLAQMWALAGGC
jgi:hypothetical protein